MALMSLPMGHLSRAPAASVHASFLAHGDKAEEQEPSEQVSLIVQIRSCPGLSPGLPQLCLQQALPRPLPDCTKNTIAGDRAPCFLFSTVQPAQTSLSAVGTQRDRGTGVGLALMALGSGKAPDT